jgi:hypothetical protein
MPHLNYWVCLLYCLVCDKAKVAVLLHMTGLRCCASYTRGWGVTLVACTWYQAILLVTT